MERPSVFDFLSYREFLEKFFQYLKSDKLFTTRQFAKQVGFGSPSYLKALTDGKRSLSLKTARQVGRRLGLTAQEAHFFEALVAFNDSQTPKEKDDAYKKILKFRKYAESNRLAADVHRYFSSWFLMAMLEGLGTNWRKSSIRKMSEDLAVSKEEIAEALKLLESLNLIKKSEDGWVRRDIIMETPQEAREVGIRELHRQMVDRARKAIDDLDPSARYLGGLTVSLSRERYDEFKQILFDLQVELGRKFAHDADPEAVYQLNVQLFPLLKLKS